MLHDNDIYQYKEQILVDKIIDDDVTLSMLDRADVPLDEIEASEVMQVMDIL